MAALPQNTLGTRSQTIHELYKALLAWRNENKSEHRIDGRPLGSEPNRNAWFYFQVGGLSLTHRGTYALNGDSHGTAVDSFIQQYETAKESRGGFPRTLDVLEESTTDGGNPHLAVKGALDQKGWYCYRH